MKWKSIKGYEGLYEVSDTGRIKSLCRITIDGKHIKEKIINGGEYSNGYKFVCLRKNGENRNFLVHRLVAEAFIPNSVNLPVVNHIDGNIHNNCVNNLEWCTYSYNLKHAVDIGLVENQCKIRRKVTIRQGEHIILFDTMKDCAAFFGFKRERVVTQSNKKAWVHFRLQRI